MNETLLLRECGNICGRGWGDDRGSRRVTQLLSFVQIDSIDYSWLAKFVSLIVLPFADEDFAIGLNRQAIDRAVGNGPTERWVE